MKLKFKLDIKEVLFLGVIIAICIWLYSVAENFPEATRRYPQFILIAAVVLALIEIISKTVKSSKSERQEPVEKKSSVVLVRVLTVAAICIMYVLLVDIFGFFSSTALFSFSLMYYLGVRKPVTLIAVAAGLNIGVYLLFVTFLRISMPQGLLF